MLHPPPVQNHPGRLVSIGDPKLCRALKDDPRLTSLELFPAKPNGHKFKAGDVCTLVGLQDFPEYNGEQVTITAIREDGSKGRAYYISGRLSEMINWVYEYRLTAAASQVQSSRAISQ